MRILFVSNYLSHSGYSNQARLIVPAIKAMGHDVEVMPIGNLHIDEITHAPDGTRLLPLGQDPLGSDIVGWHYTRGNFDAVMTFTDLQGHIPTEAYANMNWYPIFPIDTYSLIPAQMTALRACNFPIMISRFGQNVVKEQIGLESRYLPMMVDTDMWTPGNKEQAREGLGLEQGRIMFTFVGVNRDIPSRKGIPELLLAWSRIIDVLPDNTYLHMHTGKRSAVDIPQMAVGLGIPQNRLRIMDEGQYYTGLSQQEMVLMAQASDVLVQPSRREGACLPLIEFQACGVPVIASQAHAQQEYNKGQFRVRGERAWSHYGWEFEPSVTSLQEQILNAAGLINPTKEWGELSLKSGLRADIVKEYSVTTVTENHLKPIIEAMVMDVLDQE
jgi:glycosyltransferase involved in cell wall biosynthesis